MSSTDLIKSEVLESVNLALNYSNNIYSRITTRAATESIMDFKTIKSAELDTIGNFMMQTANRDMNSFGKGQSQFMNHAMTVSHYQPYRNLRQILAEVERCRVALADNIINMKRSMVKLMQKKESLQKLTDKYEIALAQIDIEEIESGMADHRLYIEGALKTILEYSYAYNDIKKKHNIPDLWDEKDFEKAEEEYHIKKAFEQAHGDVLATGRIDRGNHEYLRQLGINPQNALADILSYMENINNQMVSMASAGDRSPNIGFESFIQFLEDAYNKYKGSSKIILNYKGLNTEGYYDPALFKNITSV